MRWHSEEVQPHPVSSFANQISCSNFAMTSDKYKIKKEADIVCLENTFRFNEAKNQQNGFGAAYLKRPKAAHGEPSDLTH